MKFKIGFSRKRDILFHLIIIILLTSLSLFIIFNIYFPAFTIYGESLSVPNLKGKPIEEVDTFLKDRNLRYTIVADSAYDKNLPPYVVISQIPNSGSVIKENRLLYIKLNKKEAPTIKMPNLIDRTIDFAEQKLVSLGLVVGRKTYKPDVVINAILRQIYKGKTIKPNTIIQKGDTIDLEIGNGLTGRKFGMPKLIGMQYEDAMHLLRGSNLKVALTLEESDEEILKKHFDWPVGTITQQVPKVDSKVSSGDPIDIWVKGLMLFKNKYK